MTEDGLSGGWMEARDIWAHKSLSRQARNLWFLMRAFCDHRSRTIDWLKQEFEEEFEIGDRVRRQLLAELQAYGAVKATRSRTGRMVYGVAHPSIVAHPPGKICHVATRQNLPCGHSSHPAENAVPSRHNLPDGSRQNLPGAYSNTRDQGSETGTLSGERPAPCVADRNHESASVASAKETTEVSRGSQKEDTPTPVAPAPVADATESPHNAHVGHKVIEGGHKGWADAVNPYAAQVRQAKKAGALGGLDGSEGVLYEPDTGRLQLINGVRAAFEAEFPGLDIDEACNRAKVDRHTTALEAKRAVRKELSYMRERGRQVVPARRGPVTIESLAIARAKRQQQGLS